MSNYQCAILSRSDYVIEDIMRILGKKFKIDQKCFQLMPIRPNQITLDNQISLNSQLEQLNLQHYNALIIGVKYDRIEMMNHEIKQYTLPLDKYYTNIIIFITGLEKSEQYDEDIIIVQKMLKRFSPIKSLILSDVDKIKRYLSDNIQEMQMIQINMRDDDQAQNENNFNQQLDQLFINYRQLNNGFQNNNIQQNANILQKILIYLKNLLSPYLRFN